tara:strand:+ start:46 stop:483 length:438 start_codon:yes stop_codon:yes gene_type:complete
MFILNHTNTPKIAMSNDKDQEKENSKALRLIVILVAVIGGGVLFNNSGSNGDSNGRIINCGIYSASSKNTPRRLSLLQRLVIEDSSYILFIGKCRAEKNDKWGYTLYNPNGSKFYRAVDEIRVETKWGRDKYYVYAIKPAPQKEI